MSNWVYIPRRFSSIESQRDTCRMHRFGMMQEHSTGNLGVDMWIQSLEETHVIKQSQDVLSHLQKHTYESLMKLGQFTSLGRVCRPVVYLRILLPTGLVILATPVRSLRQKHVVWGLTIEGLTCSCAGNYCTPTVSESQEMLTNGYTRLADQLGGPPRPEFVEVLMGLPIKWTALKPLEQEVFRRWSRLFRRFSKTPLCFSRRRRRR